MAVTEAKRLISLKEFANNMPPGIVQSPEIGRYVFGSRLVDTVPYLVQPGADAAIKPDEVANTPISTQVFVFMFDISKKEELESYQQVLNAIASGWYLKIFVHREYDKDIKNMRVYIEVMARHRVISPIDGYNSLLDQMNGDQARSIR